MPTFTLKELAVIKGVSERTMQNYKKQLVDAGNFVKQSPGKFFSEAEALELAEKLHFRIPGISPPLKAKNSS